MERRRDFAQSFCSINNSYEFPRELKTGRKGEDENMKTIFRSIK